MADSKEAKQRGLRFTMPGAPHTYHVLAGMRGYYHPDHPTPVGGPGEMTLEEAKAASADPGCEVTLVDMTEAQAEKARAAIADHRGRAIPSVASLRRSTGGHEATVAESELASASTKES